MKVKTIYLSTYYGIVSAQALMEDDTIIKMETSEMIRLAVEKLNEGNKIEVPKGGRVPRITSTPCASGTNN